MTMIRYSTIKDALGVAEVHVSSWQQAYQGLLPDDFLCSLSTKQRFEIWKNAIHNFPEQTIIYEQEKRIIGFSNFGKNRDPDLSEETGEIRALYLLAEYWSNGIGYQLLKYSLEKLEERGFKKVSLWVLDTNQRAINFYQKAGFHFDGQNKREDNGKITFNEVRMIKTMHS